MFHIIPSENTALKHIFLDNFLELLLICMLLLIFYDRVVSCIILRFALLKRILEMFTCQYVQT